MTPRAAYALAGNATITVQSPTGTRFTYTVPASVASGIGPDCSRKFLAA